MNKRLDRGFPFTLVESDLVGARDYPVSTADYTTSGDYSDSHHLARNFWWALSCLYAEEILITSD